MGFSDIPMGSVIINFDGKNVGTFSTNIPRRDDGPVRFGFGQHELIFLWGTPGFQVWQGGVDERDLANYPEWFSRNAYST